MAIHSANTIPTNKHVLVCGMTGTGKSFLCEQYLSRYDYVVKLDTKDETTERQLEGVSAWDGLEENKDFTIVRNIDELDEVETKKIIYSPPYDEQNEETFNRFFKWCFDRGNTIVWVDELMSIGTVHKYPRELGRLMTQARSKNVALWCCTQRPSGIPNIVPANCSYFFVFDMALPQDRKKLVEVTGMLEMYELPKDYNFWYYKMGERQAVKAVLVKN